MAIGPDNKLPPDSFLDAKMVYGIQIPHSKQPENIFDYDAPPPNPGAKMVYGICVPQDSYVAETPKPEANIFQKIAEKISSIFSK